MAQGAPRLMIGYDGSASAATALRAAASLLRNAHASVATVASEPSVRAGTAVPMVPGVSPAAVQQAIDELSAETRRQADETAAQAVEQARTLGLDAEPVILSSSGPAWAALLDAAHRVAADVLVCGTRGRGAFARALLGSTSSNLLHHTDMPLLVVPEGAGTLDGPVVVAYDGSEGARHAIQVAGRLLGGRAAVVVHGWQPIFHRSLTARASAWGPIDDIREIVADLRAALADSAAATTNDGVAAARAAGLDAVGDAVEADDGAARAVTAAARAHGAAVIVMGSRGLGAARSALLGSVSSGLVQSAELPVLVVPGPAAG